MRGGVYGKEEPRSQLFSIERGRLLKAPRGRFKGTHWSEIEFENENTPVGF